MKFQRLVILLLTLLAVSDYAVARPTRPSPAGDHPRIFGELSGQLPLPLQFRSRRSCLRTEKRLFATGWLCTNLLRQRHQRGHDQGLARKTRTVTFSATLTLVLLDRCFGSSWRAACACQDFSRD